MEQPKVDVCMQAFGKPYQTALALLSLDQYCSSYINKIFFVIEPALPHVETTPLQLLDGLVPKMETVTVPILTGFDNLDVERLNDMDYRQSLRYQYGWEHSQANFLMLLHNDTRLKSNIVVKFLTEIGSYIGIGQIGQCWTCPASHAEVTRKTRINNGFPCQSSNYASCRCDYDGLKEAYIQCNLKGLPLRWQSEKALTQEYEKRPWPLPECRINEWCCMINLDIARNITIPVGKARPFGAYLPGHDIGVAWFRDVNHAGYRAKHIDIRPYIEHIMGHPALFNNDLYREREINAAKNIIALYPDQTEFLRKKGFSFFNSQ